MLGRKKKPHRLKLIEGNPGKEPLGDDPRDSAAAPELPVNYVLPEIKAIWEKLGPVLLKQGLLTESTGPAFLVLCGCLADYAAFRKLAPPGKDVVNPGEPSAHWSLTAAARDRAEKRLWAALDRFGLSPASSERVAKADVSPVDPFEEFLAGRKPAG